MSANAKQFFSKAEKEKILQAIKAAELNSSGEIRVHLESKTKLDPVLRAEQIFTKLALHKTKARNGILFYLAINNKKFAVIGDKGIHSVVGDEFWQRIKNHIIENFKQGKFCEGLIQGIDEAGNSLKEFFPYQADDANEQEDEISID